MSTQTPSAPSAPVATALSPVLWQVFLVHQAAKIYSLFCYKIILLEG